MNIPDLQRGISAYVTANTANPAKLRYLREVLWVQIAVIDKTIRSASFQHRIQKKHEGSD